MTRTILAHKCGGEVIEYGQGYYCRKCSKYVPYWLVIIKEVSND